MIEEIKDHAKLISVVIACSIGAMLITNYLFKADPSIETKVETVEKVVTKVETVEKIVFRDRVVFRDQSVTEKETRPDGTTITRVTNNITTTKDTELDRSVATDKLIKDVTKTVASTKLVLPTDKPRYSLGVSVDLKNTLQVLTKPRTEHIFIELGARIGNLPLFVTVVSNASFSFYGTGLKLEF